MQIIKTIWNFFQNQILGMKWLNELIGSGLNVLGLSTTNRWIDSIQFFVYDVIKITLLLCFLIFMISYIQSYFPPERSKKILGRFHGIGANVVAALLGTVTPFCSCSSIPLFIGFTSAGLSLGVTFSFLISSPMVDLGSLVLLMSIFGAKVAVIYVMVGLIIAVIGGTLIEKLHMEKYVESFILTAGSVDIESPDLTRKDRLVYAKEQMLSTFRKVFPYILIGVGIGDSTFFHSGITGLIDAVYNKSKVCVVIMDNRITAMTGHQENPGTGRTLQGEETVIIDLEKIVRAVGIKEENIRVVDPYNLAETESAVREAAAATEPFVIISKCPCALLKDVQRERAGQALRIDQEKCIKCKMCLKTGCPALSIREGQVLIDESSCNGCGLCRQLCKFGAITKAGE
jgi:uncharacterized membrane protein YraQ (UPF0718 family)/Pyruvate/2-oxoacid:ferredoxin oxidoreductase delta subunit